MELVEHRRGVQRLINEHQEHRTSENDDSRIDRRRVSITSGKERENDDHGMLSDCESETSEVLSVGSEPMPANDALAVDHDDDDDDRRSAENYESDAGTNIASRGLDNVRDDEQPRDNGRSTLIGSSPSSRSASPSPSSSASYNPPQSPASNYSTTPPENRASPSSPAASSVRSPASSSATASSPGRPDAHQEAIVPRYQSASISSGVHNQNHTSVHQNHHNHHSNHHGHHHHHHHHHHLLSSNRYAAAALVTNCRDSSSADLLEYPSVIGPSTIPRIPAIPGHHALSLSNAAHATSAVADLIGYTQQSLDPGRSSLHARATPTLNVPLVTRLSLSPPTAMTVTGLQANAPSTAFHPVAVAAAAAAAAAAAGCRDPRETGAILAGHPGHLQQSTHGLSSVQHSLLQQQASISQQIQHVPASAGLLHHHHAQHHSSSHNSRHNSIGHQHGQHRLSVNKLLQHNNQDSSSNRETESPLSPGSREDHHRHSHQHHHDVSRSNLSPGSNSLQNTSGVATTNNNHHRNSNSNNMQHQASLKFSIDNILKADFGRRITDPISLKKTRTKKVVPRPIDLTKDFVETSSESSERGSETSTTNPSPGATSSINTSSSVTSASNNATSGATSTGGTATSGGGTSENSKQMLWPAWVYCTRYSDRPSSGPRTRRVKRPSDSRGSTTTPEEKRPRTAFSGEQLARLKREFAENRYLTERRRQQLSRDLGLNEAQIKIWFQNKRAKIKKASGQKNPLALQLMAQGLYNHSTVPLTKEEEEQAAELQAK